MLKISRELGLFAMGGVGGLLIDTSVVQTSFDFMP